MKLKFREGKFRILALSDTHGDDRRLSARTKNNIETLVARETPDLVLLCGDNTHGLETEGKLRSCIADITEAFESRSIPWAHVYGNHDDEYHALEKETQHEIYRSFANCVSGETAKGVSGVGNYLLEVFDSKGEAPVFNVWALDSGTYIPKEIASDVYPIEPFFKEHAKSSYGYITPDRINWYYNKSKEIESRYGRRIPGLMFFHIPLQETAFAWYNRGALEHTGDKREAVCASEVNSGLFAAMVERGDIKAVVYGHDHVNDYMVKSCGIKLCYALTPGNNVYCNDDLLGGRVFVIDEKEPEKIETYISYI